MCLFWSSLRYRLLLCATHFRHSSSQSISARRITTLTGFELFCANFLPHACPITLVRRNHTPDKSSIRSRNAYPDTSVRRRLGRALQVLMRFVLPCFHGIQCCLTWLFLRVLSDDCSAVCCVSRFTIVDLSDNSIFLCCLINAIAYSSCEPCRIELKDFCLVSYA